MRIVGCFSLLLVISVPFFSLLQGITANEETVSHPLGNGRVFSWVYDTADQGGDGELTSIDIESVRCQTNVDCTYALPGLDIAIGTGTTDNDMGKYDAVPPKNSSGHCSCGPGNCVSYSVEYGKDIPFYYCSPCECIPKARLGSQCWNGTCDHEMAECREDYCQCYKSGFFYEFNYCEIPYVLYETSLQICIIIIIAIVSFLVVTSLCSATGLDRYWHNRRSNQGNSETSNRDAPPPYDEVIESLPSYQDAMQMAQEGNGNRENEQNFASTSSRTDERLRNTRRGIVTAFENHATLLNSPNTPSANSTNEEVPSREEQESDIPSSLRENDQLPSSQRYQPIELPLRRSVNL